MVFLNAENRYCLIPDLGQGDGGEEPAVTTQGTPAFEAKHQPPTIPDPIPGIPTAPTGGFSLRPKGLASESPRRPPLGLPN